MNLSEMSRWCELVIQAARTGKADMNNERSQLQAYGNRVPTFRDRIHPILQGIEDMLVEKNEAYGDSALNPVRVFSTADTTEQIRVRIDDKLSRLARGTAAGEDTRRDLIGYLALLELAENERPPQEAMGWSEPCPEVVCDDSVERKPVRRATK